MLLTSLNAMESDLPLRYFFVHNDEGGSAYCDTLLDAEAGIKNVLSRFDIDEIVIIGAAGSYDEGDKLGPVSAAQGSELYSSDRSSLSTYGLLRYRIAQFADGQTQSLAEDESLPEEVREKLDASARLEILPSNREVSLRLIPEGELEEGEQWVENLMSMEASIVEEVEDIKLYVSLNSDDAADTFFVMNMLDILVTMPESTVELKKIYTTRRLHRSMAGIVRDDTDGFGVTELFHAIRAFLEYGRADMIEDIWKKSGERNESIEDMVGAMRNVDIGLSMCNIPQVERGIFRLRELFRSEKFWRESGYYGMLFSLIAESIREDYGVLLEGDGDINFIEMVKWAYRHQFYQQTLTLIESRTPENLVSSGIFYYCDSEENRDHVTDLFAKQRLQFKPYEYFKIDQIDHYFIKTYDRGRVRSRCSRRDDPQRVYAVMRTESIENTDPEMITGYTACDSPETMQNALFAYYYVGYVRNTISHADARVMDGKNKAAEEGDNRSALDWMTESIDLFIESYEKAAAETRDKNPNVVIISGDEVRRLADSMRKNR